jgi:hypothetical protein
MAPKTKSGSATAKNDGVPIHVVLLFGATAFQKIMRENPGSFGRAARPGASLTAACPQPKGRIDSMPSRASGLCKIAQRDVRNRRMLAAHLGEFSTGNLV